MADAIFVLDAGSPSFKFPLFLLDGDAPVCLDADVLARLARLIPLAPLHQPHNLAPIRALLHA